MKYILQYERVVVDLDIPKFSKDIKERIKSDIEKKLLTFPHKYGKPLRKSLKGYLKLRVGDYRVIFRIEQNIIKIFAIKHRSVVYNDN